MASAEELGGSLDVDVVGLVDLDFKSEPDFFDFDSGGEYGLFGEAGVALHTTATTSSQPHPGIPHNSVGTTSHHTTPSHNKKASSNHKAKSHWSEFEKDLFLKGLDLFGVNWNRISSFISTKTPSQVRSFHKKWAETASVIQETDTFGEQPIYMPAEPVCITTDLEDPLGLIETATTTVITTPLSPKRTKTEVRHISRHIEVEEADINGLELKSLTNDVFVPSIGEEWVVETCKLVTINSETKTLERKPPHAKKKTLQHKTKKKKSALLGSLVPFKIKNPQKQRVKKRKKKLKVNLKNSERKCQTQQIVYNQPVLDQVPVPVPELGQVVHLVKNEVEESDVDIDVSDEEQLVIVDEPPSNLININVDDASHEKPMEAKESSPSIGEVVEVDNRKQQVFSFPPPVEERELDLNNATDEEKRVHFEYFDGKGVKTPERYLKIRNYLINYWKHMKPNYIRKTAVRAGLKNCGDVNSIGKVHEYLEKIGAINFGCHESNYTSPLIVGVKPKEKICLPNKPLVKMDRSEMARQKQKKWDLSLCEGGGLTISHDESGAVVDACHIPEAPRARVGAGGGQGGARMEQFKLVRCLEHDPDTAPPFSVVMHAHALITLDLHAHTSLAEVMGLLGGYYDPIARMLHVTVAVPTRAASSGVECEMCPVSQSTACTAIHEGGVQVVGWYHSHPTFPPNPSMQDLDTQNQMQQWFARQDAPFLGIIISPFCPTNRSEASQIRCIVLDKPPHSTTESNEPPLAPYKLSWSVSEVVPGAWEEVCQGVRKVVSGAREDPMSIEWRGEWRGQATNWEKAIASLNHHLPLHFQEPLQAVRTAFLAAVREYNDT